ncbi:MAG: hypothetical protein Q9195_002394 [Heterodermia aff. obscurata]
MPYLPTAQAWLEQSRLLLSARPTTTRITTKYTIKPPPPRSKKSAKESAPAPQQPSHPQPPKAFLTLKTCDPVSGICLKYNTDKAAEVGRLVASLGTCGRVMAALPDKIEPEGEEAVAGVEVGTAAAQEEVKGAKTGAKDGKPGQGKVGGPGTGSGGGKKKKGKR